MFSPTLKLPPMRVCPEMTALSSTERMPAERAQIDKVGNSEPISITVSMSSTVAAVYAYLPDKAMARTPSSCVADEIAWWTNGAAGLDTSTTENLSLSL